MAVAAGWWRVTLSQNERRGNNYVKVSMDWYVLNQILSSARILGLLPRNRLDNVLHLLEWIEHSYPLLADLPVCAGYRNLRGGFPCIILLQVVRPLLEPIFFGLRAGMDTNMKARDTDTGLP
eukprot:6012602-Amphidinium_carterae.1